MIHGEIEAQTPTHLTRIRRNYVFKGVKFYVYHGWEVVVGSSTDAAAYFFAIPL